VDFDHVFVIGRTFLGYAMVLGMERNRKATRGRPPKGEESMLQPVTIRLPVEMVRQIEALRVGRLDAPDKSTLIRELLAKALQ
jgi:hypothetical protein